jgi:hypothetical protein
METPNYGLFTPQNGNFHGLAMYKTYKGNPINLGVNTLANGYEVLTTLLVVVPWHLQP